MNESDNLEFAVLFTTVNAFFFFVHCPMYLTWYISNIFGLFKLFKMAEYISIKI